MGLSKNKTYFIENELQKLLVYLFDLGLISLDGTIRKRVLRDKLRDLLNEKKVTRVLDIDRIGAILNNHNYLIDTPKGLPVFKFDRQKLEKLSAKAKEEKSIVQSPQPALAEVKAKFEYRRTITRDLKLEAKEHLKLKLRKRDLDFGLGPKEESQKFAVDFVMNQEQLSVDFNLRNIDSVPWNVLKVYLVHGNDKTLEKAIELPGTWPIWVSKGEKFVLAMNSSYFTAEDRRYNLIISFRRIKEYVEHHKFELNCSLPKVISIKRNELRGPIQSTIFGREKQLPFHSPREFFNKFVQDEYKLEDVDKLPPKESEIVKQINDFKQNLTLTPENYVTMLKILGELEESFTDMAYDKGSLTDKTIYHGKFNNYYVYYSNPRELPPKLEDGDYLSVYEVVFHEETLIGYRPSSEEECVVKNVDADRVYFKTKSKVYPGPFCSWKKYFLRFSTDRTCFRMEYEALGNLDSTTIREVLFPKKSPSLKMTSKNFTWFNKALNPEQINAVNHILAKTALPAPYVLFGPPGTGKTSTLSEAITQIWSQKPRDHILVCASSNYACDELALRLLRHIPSNDIYRFYSKASERRLDVIHDKLLDISNLISGSHQAPSAAELSSYRIVLSTLVTAGRIALKKVKMDHFSYIFIDECGSSTEATSVIPISGLLSRDKAQLVIAGDPKQLGPVIGCPFAEELGLGKSLLERLMERDLYKSMNPNVITKLVRNYRCHPAILKFPNDLFYDGDLLAEGSPETTDFALMWPHLPNKKFPILFHAVKGRTRSEDNSFSLYNDLEVDTVVSYLRRLLSDKVNGRSLEQKEIGVISPYRKQCLRIRDALNRFGWKEVEVGSVEQFQGQERSVIIISTVRSNTATVGFLNNPKRLNVSLTRAKALLIVVGNPETLQMDPNWRKFIEYCKQNGACTGYEFELKTEASSDLENLAEIISSTFQKGIEKAIDEAFDKVFGKVLKIF